MAKKSADSQLCFAFPGESMLRERNIRRECKKVRRSSLLKLSICHRTDALYVRFSDDAVAETAEVRPGVMFDFAADGRIVAFEILDASRTLAADDM
jgi:uncharacterized protein YuzE